MNITTSNTKISEEIVNPQVDLNVDTVFLFVADNEEIVNSQPGSWWTFFYGGKPRLALICGTNEHGNMQALTADGIRTFKPSQMFNIQDVTEVRA